MAIEGEQFLRKASLLVVGNNKAIELSELRFKFQTAQQDEESPNNCSIRVYNLSRNTVQAIRDEYTRVIVQAGYENSSFGVVFDGQIKQLRIGKEDAKTTYLDILAADGDEAYNYATVKRTLAAGSTIEDRFRAAAEAMAPKGVKVGNVDFPNTGGVLPRGKVLFGMAKAVIRQQTNTALCTWSIQDGEINVIPLTGYLPGEAVVLNARTGLVGRPEQTIDGLRVRCLLNPKIIVGGLVKIDNTSINQTLRGSSNVVGSDAPGQLAFNSWTNLQLFADIAADGLYRVYVCETVGDTRGLEWYSDLICLTANAVTKKVKAYG